MPGAGEARGADAATLTGAAFCSALLRRGTVSTAAKETTTALRRERRFAFNEGGAAAGDQYPPR